MKAVSGRGQINPLHALLLGFPASFFVAAFIADITFLRTAEIQWSNFSSWLIAGGLLFAAPAMLWAIPIALRPRERTMPLAHLVLLLLMWSIGLVNALLHARDAWYSVTSLGAVLSAVTALLAMAAAWIAYAGFGRKEAR